MLVLWLLVVILLLSLAEVGFGLVLGPTTPELLVVRLKDGLGRTRGLGRGPPPPLLG